MNTTNIMIECVEFIALMFLCATAIKTGHWIVSLLMLLIGCSFIFGVRIERT